MQFDLRIVDPPSSYGGIVGAFLLLIGSVMGLLSLCSRSVKRIVGAVDLAGRATGLLAGFGLVLLGGEHLVLGARLLTLACMGAGLWLAFRRSRDLGVVGLRTLEGAALAAIAAIATRRFI